MLLLITLSLIGYVHAKCQSYDFYCNDMEMYYQCDRAQQQINKFTDMMIQLNNTYELLNNVPDLECDKYINCITEVTINECQNMQSYLQCNSAELVLDEFIIIAKNKTEIPENLYSNKPIIRCEKEDGVYEYYESDSNYLTVSLLFMLLMLFISL